MKGGNGSALGAPPATGLRAFLDEPGFFIHAACRGVDVEIFFARPGVAEGRTTYTEARMYCRRCPVQQACLNYALDNDIHHGYFGNTTERERRRIRHERRMA